MPRVITPVALPQTDAQLRAAFAALRTRADVAGTSEKELIYILYRGGKQYFEFDTPKRAGGTRHISAPTGSIKILQKRLNQVLRAVYVPKASVHGFAVARSIVTNADRHVGKQVVLNIDLEDFFPTIHFGRVRGLFATAYKLPLDVAQVLAQICVNDRVLPQGAPTSPIVSNMVCARFDTALRKLAQAHGCTYTRYADDITFSTTRPKLPDQIATFTVDGAGKRSVEVGAWLRQIIEGNKFKVNEKKVRLRVIGQRFEVTGLVVGRGVNVPREYVRGLRGLLHAWEHLCFRSKAFPNRVNR
jgi:RNA-directed DNA polymerase